MEVRAKAKTKADSRKSDSGNKSKDNSDGKRKGSREVNIGDTAGGAPERVSGLFRPE